ncbi:thyroglobulin isoform X2 [Brachyhypopomus gauderio]|uniref:thyroglobulin isoform X2 n=1 Tax=Brachyhypopomus gauderio TaxID=698409 RepID=UPI004041EFED
MNIFYAFFLLLFSYCITQAKISEYQLESDSRSPCEQQIDAGISQQDHVPQCSEDGRYRHVQCSRGGECWCVNADGTEVDGSRQNGSVVYCLTSCQLQRQGALKSGDALLPRCLDSGEYQPVQCDGTLAQCWCVDLDGMEIYGTRQNGKPSECPGICKVRERRLLHGVGEASPPQCSDDGRFLPVQCKFINTTNMMVFDLLHAFNRFPEAFQTFSGFREVFPELSSYCYCADSRGRELHSTGLELLLDEVYDTAFSSLGAAHSFSQSNMYRVLQRRYLAVQLALSGRFRCPSPCESERSAASQAGNVFVPACDARGEYMPTQCQADGQCWCVDSSGRETFGSRRYGAPDCRAGVGDCQSKRRQALSKLFYGPAGHFSQNDVFSTSQASTQKDVFPLALCSPEFQELLAKSGLTRSLSDVDHPDVGGVVAELIQGLFPTGALALKALSLTVNPKRLQENLFGGKFLKNAGNFNFSGTVGTRGTLNFSQMFSQVGRSQVSVDFKELAKIFSNDSVGLNLDQEISDVYGRTVNLKRNRDLIKDIGAILENKQFFTLLRVAITLLKTADHTQLGVLLQTVLQTLQACDSAVSPLYVPQCTEDGRYQDVQCQGLECWCVDSEGLEVMGSRSSGSRPRCPSQCEKERMMAIAVKASRSAGSEVFIPKCEDDGEYVPLQCLGKTCFCVSHSGARYNTLLSGGSLQCPTDCQITASQYFLNTVHSVLASPSPLSQLSDVFVPRCTQDGGWHHVQCDGPPETAFEFYDAWSQSNAEEKQLSVLELLGILREYAKDPRAMASFRGFLSAVFQARHQKVFPALAKFETFSEVSSEILDGNTEVISGPSVFLNPLSLWSLLRGDCTQYPGPLSDFSAPLGHFNRRRCWCVDQKGNMVSDSKAAVNQVPKCQGPCSLVRGQVDTFLAEAETLISLSNGSHVPAGYSFLLAGSAGLRPAELQRDSGPELPLAQLLQGGGTSSLRLAAHSTLQFYWQSRLMAREADRASLVLGYQPYRPQCDAHGQWLASQCHPSTGHCWCVDEDGGYVARSLSARTAQPTLCQTPCQRSQTQSIISGWNKSLSNMQFSYSPSCDEASEFSVLQRHGGVCVSPVTGQIIQLAKLNLTGHLECPGWCALQKKQAAEREAGVGFDPQCVESGQRFSPLQCDELHCWCVSENGQELVSTRLPRGSGSTPSCDTPQCPLPFEDYIPHGAVLCSKVRVTGEQRQGCEVFCHQGYASALPVEIFMCDPVRKMWLSDAPLPHACQRVYPLQTAQASVILQLSLVERQQGCQDQTSALQISLLHDMRAAGVCNLQLSPGPHSSVMSLLLCDESSVSLECESEHHLTAHITFKARLSDLPINALPDLHDIDSVLSGEKMLDGVMKIVQSETYQSVWVSRRSAAVSSPTSFGCSTGFRHLPDSSGCVICPAGSFSSGGRCEVCPLGSYQAEAGQDWCSSCPPGTSTAAPGASSPSHCVSECQRSRLSCSEEGDFLLAQKHFLSGRWLCVTLQGEELSWTSADEPITAEECQMLERFEVLASSSLLMDSADAVVLHSWSSPLPLELQLRECVLACSRDTWCHHVASFRQGDQTVCDLYSTTAANVQCRATQHSKGFLGNEDADTFQTLSCLLRVKVGAKANLTVLRKKGHEFNTAGEKNFDRLRFHKASSGVYRTLVIQSAEASLADAHRFCTDTCTQDTCCDGFILNQNVLDGGFVMCGLLSFPAVLQCSEEDWDVSGLGRSSRTCGAGLSYDEQQKRFTFEFGGQTFTITDAALPTSSKNTNDYQASIIGFQRVYLWTDSDMSSRPKAEGVCESAGLLDMPSLSDSVKMSFDVLDSSSVRTDSVRDTSNQQYWLFKHQFTSREAQIWCLLRCKEEDLCHVADLQDEGPLYFVCMLYPDTRVCGSYDEPEGRACTLALPQELHSAHQKRLDLTGSVKSFYSRVPFNKMVSYSVRSRVAVSSRPITEGFFACERRCDEDPCCRGIGYIKDTGAPGSDVLCLTLNSLGIQTCGEDFDTKWRVQDCSASAVQAGPYPFGWYQKPVTQWTDSPALCPPFRLRSPARAVNMKDWTLLDASSVLVDSSISAFDIIHISRDIANDLDGVRDWCLAACEQRDSCLAVSMATGESAVRCVMYPDSHTCLPTPNGQHCILLTKEPAQYVYIKTVLKPELTSVSIPGHGTLRGESEVKLIGAESKSVTYFLGVPYARPPIGQLRFSPPLPSDWTGTWNATFARPSCMQPGDTDDFNTSEDCLYLNIFVPSSVREATPVLVFLHNSGPDLLDGSYLAAVGNIVVVTASFRVAAYGFLSTGSPALPGNSGIQDQAAALRWVQDNIARFRGDPTKVTVGADRNGADIASLHLPSSSSSLFHQALLMGGSVFSPAAVMSGQQARDLALSLGAELGCTDMEPTQLLTCLREKPAKIINGAQTKLLAVSGPLLAWAPVVDGVVVGEDPSVALRSGRFRAVPLMLGTSAEDGLVSRAKNIKNFEQLHGRADSKTAFYEALSNSLGGGDASVFVKEAATWFYSLQHSPTPSGYNVFSRALENATRDFFIICPSVSMARFWASHSRSSVYMYHLPAEMTHSSADFDFPLDVQYVFGVPHVPAKHQYFTSTERDLSSQMMTYVANFIKSGNPNLPVSVATVSFGEVLPPWPLFLPHPSGQNYKELSVTLSNRQHLQAPQCSFWLEYVPVLNSSTGKHVCRTPAGVLGVSPTESQRGFSSDLSSSGTQTPPKSEKDAYN